MCVKYLNILHSFFILEDYTIYMIGILEGGQNYTFAILAKVLGRKFPLALHNYTPGC